MQVLEYKNLLKKLFKMKYSPSYTGHIELCDFSHLFFYK